MNRKIQAAVLGLGGYGNVHLEYLLGRDDVEVAALASTNPQKLHEAAKKVPGARLYPNHAQLLCGERRLDALFVCVPPHTHAGAEREAAGRGIHLFVEKPLGLCWNEAAENLKAIEKAGVIAAVGYQMRYAPGMDEARALTRAGPVGLMQGSYVVSMPGAPWWRKKAAGGGQVVEQSTHVLDLMRWFAGEAEYVEALPVRGALPPGDFDADDGSAALLRFAGGGVGILASGCFNTEGAVPARTCLSVFCPDAQVDVDFNAGLSLCRRGEAASFGPVQHKHAHMVDDFLGAVKTGDASRLRSPYADAMKTFRLSLAAERAVITGRGVDVEREVFE